MGSEMCIRDSLYGVLERQLEGRDYVADDYSIADIAIFPWTRSYKRQNVVIEDYPNVVAWRKRMIERPAVAKGMQAGAEFNADLRELSPEEWKGCSEPDRSSSYDPVVSPSNRSVQAPVNTCVTSDSLHSAMFYAARPSRY